MGVLCLTGQAGEPLNRDRQGASRDDADGNRIDLALGHLAATQKPNCRAIATASCASDSVLITAFSACETFQLAVDPVQLPSLPTLQDLVCHTRLLAPHVSPLVLVPRMQTPCRRLHGTRILAAATYSLSS